MIEEIKQRQERDKQLLLEEHNRRLADLKAKQEQRIDRIEEMEKKLEATKAEVGQAGEDAEAEDQADR